MIPTQRIIGPITLVKKIQACIPIILGDYEALTGKAGVPDPATFLTFLWRAANGDKNLVIPVSRLAMRREWMRHLRATGVLIKANNGCRGIKVAKPDEVRVAISCYCPKDR